MGASRVQQLQLHLIFSQRSQFNHSGVFFTRDCIQ
uniref:Uncharacterized protein n=1 Tax=Arundo donax TaxID=35708 RepID=A0A0A8ZXP7_ARUDO